MHVLVIAASQKSLAPVLDFAKPFGPLHAADIVAAIELVRRRSIGTIICDPDGWSDEEFEPLRLALESSPAELILFSRLQPETARRLVALAKQRSLQVVLRGSEDAARALRDALTMRADSSLPAALLAAISPKLAVLPDTLQAQTIGFFGSAQIPRWVGPVHEAAQMGRRSLDRWMTRAGLASAGTVLDIARLARAWHLIVDQKVPLPHVALLLGYSRLRTLGDHCDRYLGTSPSNLGKKVTIGDGLARLRQQLLTR